MKKDLQDFSDMSTFAMLNFVLSGAELLDGMSAALNATLAKVEATLKLVPVPSSGGNYNQQQRLRSRNVTVVQITNELSRERLARAVTAHDQLSNSGYSYQLVYWVRPKSSADKAADAAMLGDLLPEGTFTVLDVDSFQGETRAVAQFYCNDESWNDTTRCFDFIASNTRPKTEDHSIRSSHLYWMLGADVQWVGDLSTIVQKLTPPSEFQSLFSGLRDCLNTNYVNSNKNATTAESALGFLAGMSSCLNRNSTAPSSAAVVDYISVCGDHSRRGLGTCLQSSPPTNNPLKKAANAVKNVVSRLNKLLRRVQQGLCSALTGRRKEQTIQTRLNCPKCQHELVRYSEKFLGYTEECMIAKYRASQGATDDATLGPDVVAKCGTSDEAGGHAWCPHSVARARDVVLFDVLDLGLRDGVLARDWQVVDVDVARATSRDEFELRRAKALEEQQEPLIFHKNAVLFRNVE